MKNKKNKFYAIAAAALVLITLLFIVVFSPGVTSSVLDPIPTSPSDTSSGTDATPPENPDYSQIEITQANVQSVIRAMARSAEYYYETRCTLSYSRGSKIYPRKKWVRPGTSRVDIISENGTVTMSILYSGDNAYMWRAGSSRYHRAPVGEFTPDTSQMTMVYEDILELEPDSITDAGYTLYNSTPCIYAEAVSPTSGYRSRYWVSADTGLLLYGQTLDTDGAVICTVEAVQTLIGEQDASKFLLPDGSTPASE